MSKTTTTAESDAAAEPRSNSKIASVLELLRRPDGAALDELTAVTGWQKHTARAVRSAQQFNDGGGLAARARRGGSAWFSFGVGL